MKASIAHNVRPSVLVLGKDSKKGWNRWDIVLAKAYQRFLNELCQQCNGPKYICHTDDNRIQYKDARDECASAAVSERIQRDIAKAAEKHPNSIRFGTRVYAEPFLTEDAIADGLEFSDFRRPYLMDQAKKRGLIPEDV